MNQNSYKSSGWTLCPSKSFPGKFYYFNVLTGETAWSVSDTDIKSLDKHPNKHANYPEPSHHPDEPQTPKKTYRFEKPKFCLKKSNFKSPPIISSTQEFLTNSITNKYVSEIESPISDYGVNPFDFSNPNTTHDYSDFAVHSNSNDFATHSNPDFLNPNLRDFSANNNNDYAIPGNPNDLTSNPTDFTIPCNSTSITPTIRLPSLKLILPTSTNTTENVPRYIWAPIPIEYVNDKSQINGKTQVNKSSTEPKFGATQQPLKQSVNNNISMETIQVNGNNNRNLNEPIFDLNQQPLKRSVKNYPLPHLNQTETVASQSIINSNREEISPKANNLELIKKFRDKFNCSNAITSNTKLQPNLNPTPEPIGPKIIRKYNKIPEFESKISSKEVFTPKETLCQGDIVENKDFIDNLSENDLRTVLVKRKLGIKKNNEVPEKKSRNDLREAPITPKKKVTFQLDFSDEETSQELIGDEEPERPRNLMLSKLRQLGASENREWYVVVDLNVVQESFDFLHVFVQKDPFCKLLIPYSVYNWLSTLSVGVSRGARLVQFARQALRRIDFATKSDWVKVEKLTNSNEKSLPQNEQILHCCFKLMFNDIHVVLITGSNILYKEALDNGIHVFKIEEIQYVDSNEPELSFDIQKFKASVPNDSCLTENTVNEDPNLNADSEITSSVPNLKNDRTNVPNSKTERIKKNLFGPKNNLKEKNIESNICDISNLSDISECTMISTDIHKNKTNEYRKNTRNTEKPEKVLSTFFSEESQFKIPNFKNFVIQSKNTGKDTHLKIIGEDVTPSKDTGVKNTQTKNTNIKDIAVKDTQSKVFDKNSISRQLNLKDTGHIYRKNTTKIKDTGMKDTIENNTQMRDTIEKRCSIFEIESNFMPVTMKKIEDELRRFNMKDEIVQENFEKRIDEYYCVFRQIFEGLYDIIKDIPDLKFEGKKVWCLYDVFLILRKNGDKKIQLISEKMIVLLHEYDYQGTAKMKTNLNPDELMHVIGCGMLLVKQLKVLKDTSELLEMENDLNNLVNSIENPEDIVFDITVPDVPKNNRIDKLRDRKNYTKPRKEIIDYLKKYYPHWKDHEDSETDISLNTSQKSSKIKIVRTLGKNLSLIKLNRTKIIMDNAKANTNPKTIINTEIDKSSSRNEEKQSRKDENRDVKNENIVSSTEPIMIRSLNGVAKENEKIDFNLNESTHENTFGAITNGPRVICKIAPIKEFEEKINKNVDKLDNSEVLNTESNMSELSIRTDGHIDNIAQTKDLDNNNGVYIDDKCLNGEILHSNGITKTITLNASLNKEHTRKDKNEIINSLNYDNKIIDLSNDDSIISLNDDNGRVYNNNTKAYSLNERINFRNDDNTRIISLNEENDSLNEEILDSLINSNRHVFLCKSTCIKESNPTKGKRTLLEHRKRTGPFTISTQNNERSSLNSTNRTLLLNEDGKGTSSFDRALSLSASISVSNDIIIIEDDCVDSRNDVQFIKSFFFEFFKHYKLIVVYCEKILQDLERFNLNKKEITSIKNKALKVQNVLNKWITNLLRISVREEHEGTFQHVFPKHGNNIIYMNIIEKCLDQANTLEFTLDRIIMKTL